LSNIQDNMLYMDNVNEKLKVAPTAALVLYFSRRMFNSGLGAQYIDMIDMNAIQDLADNVSKVSMHFSDVLLFRKNIIRHLIKKILGHRPGQQICILGAGLDPLGLQIVEQYKQDIVTAVYEVDTAYMDEKKQIYQRLAPAFSNLKTITADLNNPSLLMRTLAGQGFDASKPAIIVLEGILHYITETQLRELIHGFCSRKGLHTLIFDFALPIEDVPPAFREETKSLISLVEKAIEGQFQHYSREKIGSILESLGTRSSSTSSIPLVKYSEEALNRCISNILPEATMEVVVSNI
jgi:O-methyltransferase involved in polyketide biosynthesis